MTESVISAPARPRPRTATGAGTRFWVGVALLLVLALGVRLGYVAATPEYVLVHDALDYDTHAQSIALGEGFAESRGQPTAFRPPGYPYLLGGVYALAGVETASEQERVEVARLLGAVIGTVLVALIGLVAGRLWGRRVALAALALGAVYLPLVLVGGAVMSEPLFAVFMVAAIAAALAHRRSSHRLRFAVLAGVLAGLSILTRANALVLLAPLAFAVWDGRPRFAWRSLLPPAVLVAVALATVSPWTVRNAVVFDTFLPVSTQFGSAIAGTYNDAARLDEENPASWRSLRRVPDYQEIWARLGTIPEPVLEKQFREAATEYVREHPGYVAMVAWWTSRRMLDLGGLDWSRHTASTISVTPGWANAGVVCFWLFALLAVLGACTRRARQAPLWLWAIPLLMYLSVVFLVVETPRYRTPLDPFVVLLAALGVMWGIDRLRGRQPG